MAPAASRKPAEAVGNPKRDARKKSRVARKKLQMTDLGTEADEKTGGEPIIAAVELGGGSSDHRMMPSVELECGSPERLTSRSEFYERDPEVKPRACRKLIFAEDSELTGRGSVVVPNTSEASGSGDRTRGRMGLKSSARKKCRKDGKSEDMISKSRVESPRRSRGGKKGPPSTSKARRSKKAREGRHGTADGDADDGMRRVRNRVLLRHGPSGWVARGDN